MTEKVKPIFRNNNANNQKIDGTISLIDESLIQDASLSQKGITKLSNSYNGTSEVLSPTEKALNDGLNTKLNLTGGTITGNLNVFNRLAQAQVLQRLGEIVTNKNNIKRVIFFDENGATTIIKDRSTFLQNATLSANASTLSPDVVGLSRVLNFTSDAYWEFSDSNDLSFGNGIIDSPFSIVSLINPNTLTSNNIIAKRSDLIALPQLEYQLYFTSAKKLLLMCFDNSKGGQIGRICNTAMDSDIGSYHTYISTYSGNSLNLGIKLYRDSLRIDDSDYGSGVYISMENLGANVGNFQINSLGNRAFFGNYKTGFIAIIAEELSQTQVKNIDILLRSYVGLDVVYL